MGIRKDGLWQAKLNRMEQGIFVKIQTAGKSYHIIPVYLNYNNWKRDLEKLESQIQIINAEDLIIIGDMNGRIGDRQNVEIDESVRIRKSKDIVINSNGKALLNLCEVYNLDVIKGTTPSDSAGEYTFANRNGNSVIDICMAGGEWKNRITDFRVREQVMSDHMPIQITVSFPINTEAFQKKEANNNNRLS